MTATRKDLTAWIAIAFLAISASVVAATLYEEHALGGIDAAALAIAANSSPSILHLALARGELGVELGLLDDLADAAQSGVEAPVRDLAAAREAFGRELRAYEALPEFAGERALRAGLRVYLRDFDGALDRLLEAAHARDVPTARAAESEGRRAGREVGQAMLVLVELNAHQGQEAAAHIVVLRHRAHQLAFGLAFGCVAIVAVALGAVLRAQARSAALAAARASELESFAARVAHDVMNPLAALRLTLTALTRRAGASPELTTLLARAEGTLGRAIGLVDALFAFAWAGASPTTGCANVATVAAGVLEDLRPEASATQIALHGDLDEALAVACPDGILGGVLTNLVRNAIKYMGRGPARRVTVRAEGLASRVAIEVEDTGTGIAPPLLASIFEPFVRAPGTTQPGMGLGLATVKKLVESHGGRVTVRSAHGIGTTFRVELPVSVAPASALHRHRVAERP